MATRCFCPPDSRLPRGPTLVSKPWLPFLSFGTETANTTEYFAVQIVYFKKTVEVFLSFPDSQVHPTPLGLPRYPGNYILRRETLEFPPQLPVGAVGWRQEFNLLMQNL